MTFNVKTRWGGTLRKHLLSLPVGERHLCTGFWLAALERVRGERLVRIADMTTRQFVLEADIDPTETHEMDATRIEEYVKIELLKRTGFDRSVTLNEVREHVRRRLSKGAIVVAFRNARAYDAPLDHKGRLPFWYTQV
jgi:hypothetical protein